MNKFYLVLALALLSQTNVAQAEESREEKSSIDRCQLYYADRNGAIEVKLRTLAEDPAYVRNASRLWATLFATDRPVFRAGNEYSAENAFGDRLELFVEPGERTSATGRLILAPSTVAELHARTGGAEGARESLCVDGLVIHGGELLGTRMLSGDLYLDNKPEANLFWSLPATVDAGAATGIEGGR